MHELFRRLSQPQKIVGADQNANPTNRISPTPLRIQCGTKPWPMLAFKKPVPLRARTSARAPSK